jgi:glycerol-3-phosphate acyltransferase PlsX
MGADFSPKEQVAAAVEWQKDHDDQLFLVGQADLIAAELSGADYDARQLVIVPATEVISSSEAPGAALRKKTGASIVIATGMVQQGQADALVSCGSTGAQMAAAIFMLKRLPGVERPPLLATFPAGPEQVVSLVDVGANVDCKPSQLLQFAVLGTVFQQTMLQKAAPKVGLLNNGEEETKGNAVAQETYRLLRQQANVNFIGNVEGRDLFSAKADVLVCDGFTGNLLLKTLEGMVALVGKLCYGEFGKVPELLKGFDYSQIGGLPLLGVNGISIVCHGRSRRTAVYHGIQAAVRCADNQLIALQKAALAGIA